MKTKNKLHQDLKGGGDRPFHQRSACFLAYTSIVRIISRTFHDIFQCQRRGWINTFYNNISSCVLNNGFSTSSFAVERGVRQGDPLSAHLFIIVLEILCISIRNSKDIRGIKVDNEEIKLSLFADDLTAFLKKISL